MNEHRDVPGPRAADQWPEVNRLLDEALSLADGERTAWIAALPVSPARAVVERLLVQRARVESGDFLATLPPLSPAAWASIDGDAAALASKAGDAVGPWRLLRPLGQGGMGAVWLAERTDGSLKREVALKLPNSGWNPALAERMLRERDILASLTHAHIARLYDAGFDERGRPYLALEYVDGRPIDQFVRTQAPPVRAIVALLLQVTDAVAHAHNRLVIHRDLKPSNILVDAQGQVRLLDFGIAKLVQGERTEETALTRAAGHVLTPEYASPEQVSGAPLTTSSDVYSLGVVAYELLAGCRPYRLKRGTLAELEEAIAQADPPRASEVAADPARRKALRGDLDAILNKALKKRPDQRYATVVALAEDLQRHLDGHAVLARPDSRWYVARKFVARHRVPVAAAATAVAALAIGLGVALWQAATAREHLRQARVALDREDGVRRLFVETLGGVAAMDAAAFAQPGSVARMLQSAHAELEKTFRDQPVQQLALLNAVATQLTYFGDNAGSLAAWQRYLLLAKAQRSDAHQLLEGYIGAAKALYYLQRASEIEALAREGLALTATSPDVTGTRAELAYELVNPLLQRGARTEARALIDEHARALQASDHPNHKVRWVLTSARARMERDYDDIEWLHWATQAQAGYASNTDSSVSQLGWSALHVGGAHAALGQLEQAEAAFKVGLAHYDRIFSREDRDAVTALADLAHAIAARGRFDEARAMLDERRRLVETKPGPDTPVALRVLLARQVEVALLHGDLVLAAALIEPMRAAFSTLPDERARGPAVINEARWRLLEGRPATAADLLGGWLAKLPPERRVEPRALRARVLQAEAMLALGRDGPARATLQEALAELRRIGATRNWLYRRALELQAVAQAADASAGREQLAAVWSTLEQSEREAGVDAIEAPSAVERAESMRWRASVLRKADRTAAAEALESSWRDALQGQHPASPRRAWLESGRS